MAEDKGFKPTPKKLKEARKKGQVLKSPLVSQSGAVTGSVIGLFVSTGFLGGDFLKESEILFENGSSPLAIIHSVSLLKTLLSILFVTAFTGAFFALFLEYFQVGLEFHPGVIFRGLERINPFQGIKKMGESLLKGWHIPLKVILLLTFLWLFVAGVTEWGGKPFTPSPARAVKEAFTLIKSLTVWGIIFLIVSSAVEYLFKRRQFYREMSMSLDELRRENKEEEGDPHIKGHRRQLHYDLAMTEMQQRIRKSKVLLVERG